VNAIESDADRPIEPALATNPYPRVVDLVGASSIADPLPDRHAPDALSRPLDDAQRSSTRSSPGREQQMSALPSAGGSTGSGA
jgi:hypothetical protein